MAAVTVMLRVQSEWEAVGELVQPEVRNSFQPILCQIRYTVSVRQVELEVPVEVRRMEHPAVLEEIRPSRSIIRILQQLASSPLRVEVVVVAVGSLDGIAAADAVVEKHLKDRLLQSEHQIQAMEETPAMAEDQAH